MKTVRDLLSGINYNVIHGDLETPIFQVVYDSRRITDNSLFVCIKGFVSDGHMFLRTAAQQGATAIVIQKDQTVHSDSALMEICREFGCSLFSVEDSRQALASISANIFDTPCDHLCLYGITGTKGKTTTTYMLRDIFLAAGKQSGLIGTVSNIIGDKVLPASHTTPESYELQAILADMVSAKLDNCVMEVSSQGLKLSRVHACRFAVGAFTNLYHDHIGANEHADMDDYLDAKLQIFDISENALINTDCSVADKAIAYARTRCNVYTYGMDKDADIIATDLRKEQKNGSIGTTFTLRSPWYNGEVFVSMPGRFNVYNALCATGIAGIAGVPFDCVLSALANAYVPGRIQFVPNPLAYQVYVDYAHNAASLENLLETLREYCTGRLITVFGCGGNRSKTRRYEMGEIAGKMSDLTVITSDNPRNEDPMAIIDDILQGFAKTDGDYLMEPDRKEAIRLALSQAQKDDFVVIAGKGHENYQIFRDKTIHFDDAETALALMTEMKSHE